MTLRARLVTALGAFVTLGLAAFGFATYVRYSNVEYQRLDDQLRSALPSVSRQRGMWRSCKTIEANSPPKDRSFLTTMKARTASMQSNGSASRRGVTVTSACGGARMSGRRSGKRRLNIRQDLPRSHRPRPSVVSIATCIWVVQCGCR